MALERRLYKELTEWKGRDGRCALLIEGARGVGKTTLAEEFARNEYRSYVILDFSKPCDEVKDLFENHLRNLDDFFLRLSVIGHKKLYPRESLIIFDEVQDYPPARAAVKRLVEDGRYDYVETGSLVSIDKNVKDILIPSEEHPVKMYPLDFEEFCQALGEKSIAECIREHFDDRAPMDGFMHKRAMHVFEEYMLIGGMPACVDAYVRGGKDIAAAQTKKGSILRQYESDVSRISAGTSKVSDIYDMIPEFLSCRNKRIVFRRICDGTSSSYYRNALSWLEESMICNVVPQREDPNLYMPYIQGRKSVKCYMGDTGLLLERIAERQRGERNALYRDILSGNILVDNASLYENAVAQMLTASGHVLYFYSRYNAETFKRDIEIDFLMKDGRTIEHKIVPILLKTRPSYSLESLNRFRGAYGDLVSQCVIVHQGNLEEIEGTLYIPPYMAFCL